MFGFSDQYGETGNLGMVEANIGVPVSTRSICLMMGD
jgi:hypothetical protein